MEIDKQRDIIGLVKEMRLAQRDFFRTRTTEALHRSKYLERLVDAQLERMDKKEEQPTLFD